MPQTDTSRPLEASVLPAHLLASPIGPADPRQPLCITLRLLPRGGEDALVQAAMAIGAQPLAARRHLDRGALAAAIGPDEAALPAIRAFCDRHGFTLERTALGGLFVTIAGETAALAAAFGVTPGLYRHGELTLLGYEGALRVPAPLGPFVGAVLGLDGMAALAARRSSAMAFDEPVSLANNLPTTVAFDYYDYPQGPTGKGAVVAFLESDLVVDLAAIQAFFTSLGLGQVSIVLDRPPLAEEPEEDEPTLNGEAMMDLKLVGAVAPGATLIAYSQARSYGYSSDPWVDSLLAALENETYRCNVISISLGSPESNWVPQTAVTVHLIFAVAALIGVTICIASGDFGAPGNPDGRLQQNCAFPASSSLCLACGGTELVLEQRGDQRVLVNEVAWNEMQSPGEKLATGGGISTLFTVPDYQAALTLPPPFNPGQGGGRGVPDVASNAARRSGYALAPNGLGDGYGTSAAAPMWAALSALLVEMNGGAPIGFLTPLLYGLQTGGTTCCTAILEGNNGPPPGIQGIAGPFACYPAGAPWNACCGLGSPLGQSIATALGLGTAS